MKSYPVFLLLVLCSALYASAVMAAESNAVGVAETAFGEVVAQTRSGEQRVLLTGSRVFDGDRLITGEDSQVTLKMADGAILYLYHDTEFVIEAYEYLPESTVGKSVYKLVRGGLRSVTGVISNRKNDRYQLKTPVATIGIRGTDYLVRLCGSEDCAGDAIGDSAMAEGLYVSVLQGGVGVRNNAGKAPVLPGQYIYVASANTMPERVAAPSVSVFGDLAALSEGTLSPTPGDSAAPASKEGTSGEKKTIATVLGIIAVIIGIIAL